jgi:hypothetical protein
MLTKNEKKDLITGDKPECMDWLNVNFLAADGLEAPEGDPDFLNDRTCAGSDGICIISSGMRPVTRRVRC